MYLSSDIWPLAQGYLLVCTLNLDFVEVGRRSSGPTRLVVKETFCLVLGVVAVGGPFSLDLAEDEEIRGRGHLRRRRGSFT